MNNHGPRIIFEQFTVSISYSTFRMRAVSLTCHYAQRSHISGFAPEKNEMSRKKKKTTVFFSESMCSQKFLPLSSFCEMFVNSCQLKKNLGSRWLLRFPPGF